MTQVINDKLKKCCSQCNKYMDSPCAWLSLGNEYCTEIMEVQQEIERLNNIIEKLEQENAVLKTQVVNKDKYSYGIRMGSDKE